MIRAAIPTAPNMRKNVIQVQHHFVHFLIDYLREHINEYKIEPIDIRAEDVLPLLESSKEKPFDIMISIRASEGGLKARPIMQKMGIKLMLMHDDLHWSSPDQIKRRMKLWGEADVLLIPYFLQIQKHSQYRHLLDKCINFPWFAPTSALAQTKPYQEREAKAVLSGCCGGVYPIRTAVSQEARKDKNTYVHLGHPGYSPGYYSHKKIGDKYYEFIGKFKAGIVTSASSPLNYIVAKYFEIPGCGCLPFMETVPGLEDLGFEPYVNYIPITRGDFKKKITAEAIESGEEIARAARELVRQRHSEEARAKQIVDIIYNRFGGELK